LGLPINMRVHRKNGDTLIELALQMINQLHQWLRKLKNSSTNLSLITGNSTIRSAPLSPPLPTSARKRNDRHGYHRGYANQRNDCRG
jgi:hypothetical protein